MNLVGDAYIGAVTAISFSPDGNYIVYGCSRFGWLCIGSGSFIHIYDNKTFRSIKTVRALILSAIHGIRFGWTL